ncbi:hypothetical protein [Flavobacterium sp.]|uniref:DUF7793 family protein n=1 Tax=Flavobacterium sp. TaxID=239 RepID=UPI003C667D4E
MVENDYIKLWLENDMLFSSFKKPIRLTLEESKKFVELRCLISNSECQYWCMNLAGVKFISNEASTFLHENGQELLHACAMVVNSHLIKFMAKVFISSRKTKIPVKIFTSEKEALLWLNDIKKQNIKQ